MLRGLFREGRHGRLQLDDAWLPYLSTTKDDINDAPVKDALMEFVYGEIEALLKQAEERHDSLILAGFQANLEKMFTGIGKVEVPSKGKAETPGPLTGLHQTTVPTGTGTPHRKPYPVDTNGADTTKPDPAQTKVRIVKETDDQLVGRLCRVSIDPGSINAYVNRNHGIVQDALVNESSTLALMIVQEIASQVAFDAERLRAWFSRKGLNAIEERDDEDRVGFVTPPVYGRLGDSCRIASKTGPEPSGPDQLARGKHEKRRTSRPDHGPRKTCTRP